MIHITIFCYIIAILVGCSAFTIQWLTNNITREKTFANVNTFMLVLLFMNALDFFIYYNDNFMELFDRVTLVSIGGCVIAVLIYLWLSVGNYFVDDRESSVGMFIKVAKVYVVFYLATWIVTMFFFNDSQWVRVVIDVPLMILLVAGSAMIVVKSVKNKYSKDIKAYLIVISLFMAINYSMYFIHESEIYDKVSFMGEDNLDFTILYWLIINLANLIFFYKCRFVFAKEEEFKEITEFDMEKSLIGLRKKYGLTAREIDLVREIYNGKTNSEIATALFISESTVKAHIYNIFKKLGVKNRVGVTCKLRDHRKDTVEF